MGVTRTDYEIVGVKVVSYGVLALRFADGLEGEVDLHGHLWGPVFENVRTPDGFDEVYIDCGTVTWPGPVDLAPDTLYIRVKTGEWPAGLNRPSTAV